ncbi:MAG: hypothetical protein R6V59_09465 [Dehalococcoidia bacterium]
MNRVEVLEKLEPIAHTTVRQVEHTPRTRVLVQPGQVVIRPGSGGLLVPLSKDGTKALTNFVGLPQKLCQELSPELFGRVATELLGRKERYNLLLDGDEVQNFSEYRGVRNLPVERVLTTIERAINRCDYHRVTMLPNYTVALEITGAQEQAVRRGDLVRAGAVVTFSPINTVMPAVQSYILRLVCTNGATSKVVLAQYSGGGGEGDHVWQWFRQSVQAAYQSVGDFVNRYREMIQERIPAEQRAGVLEELLRQAGITGKEAEAVRAQAIQNPPRNSYDMVNLITWASSHIVRSPQRIQRALNAGATFTEQSEHARVCPLCHIRQKS